MNFFYNKKNQRIIAGVIAGLLILAWLLQQYLVYREGLEEANCEGD